MKRNTFVVLGVGILLLGFSTLSQGPKKATAQEVLVAKTR